MEKTGETPEKEQIELKEGEEKKDETTEKGKKKKEKKEKKPKEPKEKGPNCIDVISKDLNLGNRDSNNVNVEIDVSISCYISHSLRNSFTLCSKSEKVTRYPNQQFCLNFFLPKSIRIDFYSGPLHYKKFPKICCCILVGILLTPPKCTFWARVG